MNKPRDSIVLWALCLGNKQMHRRLNERWAMMDYIQKNTDENGMMHLVESGMDCDGVQYAGRVHYVPANYRSLIALYDEVGEWADGPFDLTVISPGDVEAVEYHSIDLGTRAFEDGHQHCIHV